MIKDIGLKRIAVIGFIALALMVAGGRLLAAMQPTTTADLLLGTLDTLDSQHQPCKPVGLPSMISMEGLLPCMNQPAIQPVAHLVGKLCVSFEWFCTASPWSSVMSNLMQSHHPVSDIMLDEDAITFMGERDDASWRIQMLPDIIDSLDPQQTKVLFSFINAVREEMFLDEVSRQQAGLKALDGVEAVDRIADSLERNLAKSSDEIYASGLHKVILERFKPKTRHGSGVTDAVLEHQVSK